MLQRNRCPKCTLEMPCRHYESVREVLESKEALFTIDEWRRLSVQSRQRVSKMRRVVLGKEERAQSEKKQRVVRVQRKKMSVGEEWSRMPISVKQRRL